jgi:hypothetical protein
MGEDTADVLSGIPDNPLIRKPDASRQEVQIPYDPPIHFLEEEKPGQMESFDQTVNQVADKALEVSGIKPNLDLDVLTIHVMPPVGDTAPARTAVLLVSLPDTEGQTELLAATPEGLLYKLRVEPQHSGFPETSVNRMTFTSLPDRQGNTHPLLPGIRDLDVINNSAVLSDGSEVVLERRRLTSVNEPLLNQLNRGVKPLTS